VQIDGRQLIATINKPVLLEAIDDYLQSWQEGDRLNLPLPSRVEETEFHVITPEVVHWEIWPLVFECRQEGCGRIATFRRLQDIPNPARCWYCRGMLRQLRYYSAHSCGNVQPMYVPRCPVEDHGYAHVYFEDTGTFRTALFRCRACGGSVIRRTAFSPCSCGRFPDQNGRSIMRAYTVRDTRTYYPHSLTLINLQSSVFRDLQTHPSRGDIAVASYLGLSENVAEALQEADYGSSNGSRMSAEEWSNRESQLRTMGISEEEIAAIRKSMGPREAGLSAVRSVDPSILELGKSQRLVERAVLLDKSQVQRITLAQAYDDAIDRGQVTAARAIAEAQQRAADLGIEELSVTWTFPVAVATFGYTRSVRERGEGQIRGFARRDAYDGKTPVFAVATETEALLITVSASRVLSWLAETGCYSGEVPSDPRAAREMILEIFARRETVPEPAHRVVTLLHSMSHALLRSLDDGQIGFAEASLAEWIVPQTLTFALYANSLKSYTLGALWTLINNRSLQWLQRATQLVRTCENDPLCHQRRPRACERCLYLTFGCPSFNDDLSREVVGEFWRGA
jgi:hypothetical protein